MTRQSPTSTQNSGEHLVRTPARIYTSANIPDIVYCAYNDNVTEWKCVLILFCKAGVTLTYKVLSSCAMIATILREHMQNEHSI